MNDKVSTKLVYHIIKQKLEVMRIPEYIEEAIRKSIINFDYLDLINMILDIPEVVKGEFQIDKGKVRVEFNVRNESFHFHDKIIKIKPIDFQCWAEIRSISPCTPIGWCKPTRPPNFIRNEPAEVCMGDFTPSRCYFTPSTILKVIRGVINVVRIPNIDSNYSKPYVKYVYELNKDNQDVRDVYLNFFPE